MTSPDVFHSSFRAMTDGELVARWARQQLTDEARPVAAAELRARGIDPDQIDVRGEMQRQERDATAFRKGQRQRAGKIGLRLVLTIIAAIVSAFGAVAAAFILR